MDTLNPLIITFNCARRLVQPEVFAHHIVNSLSSINRPDILVFSLQEIAPIADAFIGSSYLVEYFDRLHLTADLVAKAWGIGYINLVTRHVGMTAIMAFVRKDHSGRIRWMETGGVGVGLYEMGNKGAVGFRIGYAVDEDTIEMTFIAVHLAPMEDALERRNEDWEQIVRRLVFTARDRKVHGISTRRKGKQTSPSEPGGEEEPLLPGPADNNTKPISGIYTPSSYLFVAGDLNYRTSSTKPVPADVPLYPQPSNINDPKHYSNLLSSDQLIPELEAGRTCHGLTEPAISFPPTYKYSDKARAALKAEEQRIQASNHERGDSGEESTQETWGWAPHRWPSWCDRILYLDLPEWMKSQKPSAKIQVHEYKALPLMSSSDHRAVALSLSIPLLPIPPPDDEVPADDVRMHPPFEIDPRWREKRAAARRWEIAVGILAYLGLTWEGNGIILAIVVGVLAGWGFVSSMLNAKLSDLPH